MISADYLLSGGTVVTVDPKRRVIRDGAVAIAGSRIVAVGKREELESTVAAKRVIDCKERLIMPGLVNSHVHFYHTMHRGLTPERLRSWDWSNFVHGKIATVLTQEDEIVGGLTVLLEMLKSGTTTFLEAGSYNPSAVMEAISRIGMRGLMGRRSFDKAILGHGMLMDDTQTCLSCNRRFLEQYRDGYNGGLVKPCVDVVGLGRVSDELYRESKAMADDFGTVLNFHLAAFPEEVAHLRKERDMTPVEHVTRLGAAGDNVVYVHMVHVSDSDVKLLADTGSNVVHCPATAVKLNCGLFEHAKFPQMLDAGVNVALGTDCSDSSNHADMIRTMQLAALLPKEYCEDPAAGTAETAIEMATIRGARALGMEKEIGSLETGKKADVIIVDMARPEWAPNHNELQNLVYSAAGDAVRTVFVEGRILMEERRVLTVNEDEIVYQCKVAGEQVLKRSGVSIDTRWAFE